MPWIVEAFAAVPHWFWLAVAFVYGSVIGSFLNVCIWRIPRGEEIVRTPSHCPSCGEPIAWYLNIPIVSWFVLRGRAACCGSRISSQYPLVELASAVLTAYLFHVHGMGPELFSAWLLTCLLLVLMFVDWQTLTLPDVLTLPGALMGLVFAAFGVRIDLLDSTIGLAVGAGGFLAIAYLYRATRGREGMGMGDVKLMAMIGAFLGWQKTLLVVVFGSVLGLAIGLLMISRSAEGALRQLPFGTFLAIAAIIVLLWGDPMLAWYTDMVLPPVAIP